jgi:outer membrane protein assembly factor BamA
MITRTYPRRGVPAFGLCLCTLVGTASLLATSSTSASARPEEPTAIQSPQASPLKIASIKVIGNKGVRTKDILAMAKLKRGDSLTPEKLKEAQENIAKTGFFGFKSNTLEEAVNISQEVKGEEVHLLIKVDENPVIKGVEIIGTGPLRPEQVVKVLTIKPSLVYNPLRFQKDALAILELYNKRGYRAYLLPDCFPTQVNVLNIQLLVTKIAEINIRGTTHVPAETIHNLLKVKAGDYFNVKRLLEARRRLINSKYFNEVDITEKDMGPGRLGITLDLKDAEK